MSRHTQRVQGSRPRRQRNKNREALLSASERHCETDFQNNFTEKRQIRTCTSRYHALYSETLPIWETAHLAPRRPQEATFEQGTCGWSREQEQHLHVPALDTKLAVSCTSPSARTSNVEDLLHRSSNRYFSSMAFSMHSTTEQT